MNKKIKSLGISSIIIDAIAAVWSFAGTIMMFLDKREVVVDSTIDWKKSYFSTYSNKWVFYYNYTYDYVPHPISGVMPLFGFLLIVAALILLAVSMKKKNRKLAIGTIVLSFVAQGLLYPSTIVADHDGIGIAFTAYIACCMPSGFLMSVTSILAIVYVTIKDKPKAAPALVQQSDTQESTAMVAVPQQNNSGNPQQVAMPDANGIVYSVTGARGRSMKVYEDKVVLKVNVTFGSLLTGNATDGEKTIYFVDCNGVQYKKSGITLGYLQFETAGMIMNNHQNNFFNENTFTWDQSNPETTEAKMEEIANYVKGKIDECKKAKHQGGTTTIVQQTSAADELKKFKELLDTGAITQEEYDAKKKALLGL